MPVLRRFLLVDDDPVFSRILARALTRRGYEVIRAASSEEALAAAMQTVPGWVVLDLNLAGKSGLALLPALRALDPRMRILVLTGYASIETAVDAVKLGATHYLAKPATAEDILRGLGCAAAADTPAVAARGEAKSIERLEWEHLRSQLAAHGGNVSATARTLKMNLRTLQRKIAKYQGTTREIPLDRLRARRRRPGKVVQPSGTDEQ